MVLEVGKSAPFSFGPLFLPGLFMHIVGKSQISLNLACKVLSSTFEKPE